MINEKIDFVSRLEPILKSGEYTLNLEQQVTNKEGIKPYFKSEKFHIEKKIQVAGERFRLEAPQIHSQFPPPNNTGDHAGALPQVVLNRATLPWERDATTVDETIPWMMVLVLYESELAAGKGIILRRENASDYVDFGSAKVSGKINLFNEIGQDADDKIDILELEKSFAKQLIASKEALKLMTSVRQNRKSNKLISEFATCFANRLPAVGEKSHAFLVSLEQRYNDNGFDYTNGVKNGKVLLVSLSDWAFSCPNETEFELTNQTLTKLENKELSNLNIKTNPNITVGEYLKTTLALDTLYRGKKRFKDLLPEIFGGSSLIDKSNQIEILNCLSIPTQSFEGILEKVNKGDFQLDIPKLQNDQYASPYLKRAAVVLPHHLRGGQQTISWYHGPLMTGKLHKNLSDDLLPIRTSDTLYQYNQDINMLDVSYAAAWELGRLLMLNNPHIAKELFAWKQVNSSKLLDTDKQLANDHLPFTNLDFTDQSFSENLQQWFNNLCLLHDVPFNYLVPEERLLPNESIRFFEMNNYWIECLLDGAFSIGRVTGKDYEHDMEHRKNGAIPVSAHPKVTGFLLRSEVVSGWPSLQVDGYGTKQDPDSFKTADTLELLRIERISPTLLICLFKGVVKTVDLHLKAETLHMGYDDLGDGHSDYFKKLRNLSDGKENGKTLEISWKDQQLRLVDMEQQAKLIKNALANNSSALNAGQFALEMLVGVPRIRFNTKNFTKQSIKLKKYNENIIGRTTRYQ